MAYVSGGIVTILVAVLAFFVSNPAQDYAISVDPVLSKDREEPIHMSP